MSTPSNKDLAISFATFHHLATLALCPDTDPAALEKAIIKIANDSVALAELYQEATNEDIGQKLWIDIPLDLIKDLEGQS